jgi:hypothetical protein
METKSIELLRFFSKYQRILVVANNDSYSHNFIEKLNINESDLIILFNRHRFSIPLELKNRVLWVHRASSYNNDYHGLNSNHPQEGITRLCISEINQKNTDGIYNLNYRTDVAAFESYPKRRIEKGEEILENSPTTGFLLISFLMQLKSIGAKFDVLAYGFIGGHGLRAHDWLYERNALLNYDIHTYDAQGKAIKKRSPETAFSLLMKRKASQIRGFFRK